MFMQFFYDAQNDTHLSKFYKSIYLEIIVLNKYKMRVIRLAEVDL